MREFFSERGDIFAIQDEDETQDWTLNWLPYLGNDDTISSATFTATGVTVTTSSNTTTTTTMWVQGTTGSVKVQITTAQGRVREKTITFKAKVR